MIARKRRYFLLPAAMLAATVVLALVFGLSESAILDQGMGGAAQKAFIRDLHASDDRVSFVLDTPVVSDPPHDLARIDGLDERSSAPGVPALPYYSTYVALPANSTPRLTVRQGNTVLLREVILPVPLEEFVEVAPYYDDVFGDSAFAEPLAPIAWAKGAVEAPAGLFPAKIVEISEPMLLRDIRLARVSIYPLRYDVLEHNLSITPEIEVAIEFVRDEPAQAIRPAPSYNDRHMAAAAQLVINPEQLTEFRGLPVAQESAGSLLPLGIDLFKIAVTEDGIHELTYNDLVEAGMPVDEVDPATIEMLYRGTPVATRFEGDSDAAFEPGESIRFYGQAFEGSRLERQFINDNIYWLWTGGAADPIAFKASVPGQPITTYLASLTREPESIYFQGFTADWPENEPDAWYWDWLVMTQTPLSRTYTMTLPNPADTGPPVLFTAEFSSRDSHISDQSHSLTVSMNSNDNTAGHSWWGEKNFNVSANVPISNVQNGLNEFEVTAQTQGVSAHLVLNRITVEYQRMLVAGGDELIFTDAVSGNHRYDVLGFGQPDQEEILVWDITTPYSPAEIMSSTITVSGDGPYTVTFGVAHQGEAKFIVTTEANLHSPAGISHFVASELDPLDGADWVAIAFGDFITETRRLAAHRSQATFGGLVTHVVDVENIINEYGYGLPVPGAIQDYLIHAMADWSLRPSYVTLVGDTTLDPRHIKEDWTDQQYVPTDLVFVDRYNGQIPSDYTFALVSGSDTLPDLAVGRLAVQNEKELASAIDKIIRYDENQLLSFSWMQNMLFLGDQTDLTAGDFCHENLLLAERLPASLNPEFLCLDDYGDGGSLDGDALRADLIAYLEDTGATMLTYRGHGAIGHWGGNPTIFSLADVPDLNNQQPFVAVSGDCLDGHYAYPPWEGLGERLFSSIVPPEEIAGAAAHWGSSGLGLSSHHTSILNGFYDGLFDVGLTALGDAVNYAKVAYAQSAWNDPALMYSFNLQGDPAMHLMRPNIELQGAWQREIVRSDEQAVFAMDVQNHGVYPVPVTLVGLELPGFNFSSISSTVASSTTIVGGGVEIALQFGEGPGEAGIPRNGQASIMITYELTAGLPLGRRVGQFAALNNGLDAWPGDETLSEDILVLKRSTWLPAIRQ